MRRDLRQHLSAATRWHYQQDALFHATVDLVGNVIGIVEGELRAEYLPDELIQRIMHRLLYSVATPAELAQLADKIDLRQDFLQHIEAH